MARLFLDLLPATDSEGGLDTKLEGLRTPEQELQPDKTAIPRIYCASSPRLPGAKSTEGKDGPLDPGRTSQLPATGSIMPIPNLTHA
jgi:hypothetical protein